MGRRTHADAAVGLAVLAAGAWWLLAEAATPPPLPSPGTVPAPDAGPTPSPATDSTPSAPRRDEAPASDFVSVDEDGNPIANPVRDGVVVAVRFADGRPCAQCPIVVHWRKGFGLYGKDRGATDADGRFATTAREIPFFEDVTLAHPTLGDFGNGATPVAAADDPRRVDYVVPAMVDMRIVVCGLDGAPLEGAKVAASPSPEPVGLRATMLAPRLPPPAAEEAPATDAGGVLTLRLPVGVCELKASVDGGKPAQTVQARVPVGGGEIPLLALAPTARIPVAVTVDLPPGVDRIDWSNAWGNAPLPAPASPLVLSHVDEQRDYELVATGRGTYEARVDLLPWRVTTRTKAGLFAGAAVAAGQRAVRLALAPTPPDPNAGPLALLRVEVRDADDRPCDDANVRVHEGANLVHGSDHPVERDGIVTLRQRATGTRVCVSARGKHTPWTLSAPLALTEGEHRITLRLQPGGTVRGRVVDAAGRPLAADVRLLRPSMQLRELADGVPDVLPDPASGETVDTGAPGEFTFHGLGPGEHEVWAHPDDGGLPARARVRAGDDVTLRPGQGCEDVFLLAFDAVDAVTGAPVALTDLRVRGAVSGPMRADEGARFGPAAVRAGEVTVEAYAIGYAEFEQRLVVGPAAPRCALRLQPSPLRFVRVRDARGAPVWPAEVRARAADGADVGWIDEFGRWGGTVLRTDRNGCVTLRGLPTGAHTLVVARGTRGEGPSQQFAVDATAGLDARLELVWRD